ncbi:MAG: hypothetical protein ACI88H_002372 [Cocleimonas sp.]|jgi:hypothetical protein
MNLFSLLLLKKITSQQLKTINTIVKLFGIFLLILPTSQNVQAFELNIDTTNIDEISTKQSNIWTYRDLVNGKLIKNIPSLLVFTQRDAAYAVKTIRDKYLTFYSNKNEKLKATYDSGAYLIKYTHRW